MRFGCGHRMGSGFSLVRVVAQFKRELFMQFVRDEMTGF